MQWSRIFSIILLFAIARGGTAGMLSAQEVTKTISVKVENVTLLQALQEINRQSGNMVVFRSEEVEKVTKTVTIDMKDAKVIEELTYTQIGEYLYPDLTLPEAEDVQMGKYGMLHKTYLKENKPMLYDRLLLAGKLDGHLMDIDRRATEMVEQLTRELAQQNRVDEEMKATNQMAWVQAMNNFKASAEEVVLRQLIYS